MVASKPAEEDPLECGVGCGLRNAPTPRCALLLLGPTGSGKTPLGECLEQRGLWGRRCHHFDFGANLRAVADRASPPSWLTAEDMALVRRVLATGALLENETFHVAERILTAFLRERQAKGADLLVLNGLPRHAGQARDVDRLARVCLVVHLDCSPQTVHERIHTNAGGDRGERSDDSVAEVVRKLGLFRERTMPLLDHYEGKGVRIVKVIVETATSPDEIRHRLERERVGPVPALQSSSIPVAMGCR